MQVLVLLQVHDTYLRVASDALRLAEYTSMNPCTNSSRNAFAPWNDETITSTFLFESSRNVSRMILRSPLKKQHWWLSRGPNTFSTEYGSPQNIHIIILQSDQTINSGFNFHQNRDFVWQVWSFKWWLYSHTPPHLTGVQSCPLTPSHTDNFTSSTTECTVSLIIM